MMHLNFLRSIHTPWKNNTCYNARELIGAIALLYHQVRLHWEAYIWPKLDIQIKLYRLAISHSGNNWGNSLQNVVYCRRCYWEWQLDQIIIFSSIRDREIVLRQLRTSLHSEKTVIIFIKAWYTLQQMQYN